MYKRQDERKQGGQNRMKPEINPLAGGLKALFWKKKKEEQQGEKQEKVFFLHNPPNILVLRRSDVGYPDEHTGEAARCFSSGYPLLCHKTIILN